MIAPHRYAIGQGFSELPDYLRPIEGERNADVSDQEAALVLSTLQRLVGETERRMRREIADHLGNPPASGTKIVDLLNHRGLDCWDKLVSVDAFAGLTDLIEAVRHRALRHLRSSAMRRCRQGHLTPLAGNGSGDDLLTVLAAAGDKEMSAAIREHRDDAAAKTGALGEPQLDLLELAPATARRLLFWIGAIIRSRLLDRPGLDHTRIDDAVEAVLDKVVPSEGVESGRFGATQVTARLADRLAATDAVTPDLLVRSLRQGHLDIFEHVFARLTSLDIVRVRRILFDRGAEAFAIVCRALGIDRQHFATLYLLLYQNGDRAVEDLGSFSEILRLHGSIDPQDARRTLRLWRRDPAYVESIDRLENA